MNNNVSKAVFEFRKCLITLRYYVDESIVNDIEKRFDLLLSKIQEVPANEDNKSKFPSIEEFNKVIQEVYKDKRFDKMQSQPLPVSEDVDKAGEDESNFVEHLISELPEYGIDTSTWEYDYGDCCYGGAIQFIARCIKGYAEKQQPDKAIEFAEWISGEGYMQYDGVGRWIAPQNNNNVYTTQELYEQWSSQLKK